MLSIATGYSPEYLTNEVAAGRENYYTGVVAEGEPPGRWHGAGAEALGLRGLVGEQDMTALYERFLDPRDPNFRNPQAWDEVSTLGHTGRKYRTEEQLYNEALEREPDASPERRSELWLDAGKRAQKNVAFLDATFSVQKSVTVLHTAFEAKEVAARNADDLEAAEAWGQHRAAVEDAIWAGNRAALDYLAEHAGYARVGHHGGAAGRYVDAHDWTIASFFQHDNRDHEPQLHVHNAILNRVEGPDGGWRTLDSRAIHRHRGAAAAVGERTMEEHLTAALGVRFATRPDGKAREVLGITPETMALFNSRRRAITPKVAELAQAYEERFGRAPNAAVLDRLARQATFATRKAKSHEGETREQMVERWDRQLRDEIAGGLAEVAGDVLALHQHGPAPAEWSESEVLQTALAQLQAKKAAWTAPELTRAIGDALPDHLGTHDAAEMTALLDGLTQQGLALATPLEGARPGDAELPAELRLTDGQSAYQAPGAARYATAEHCATERVLTASTAETGAAAVPDSAARRFVDALGEAGIALGDDQAAAVHGVLTSGARVESLVGPAGTGKSFVVGALAKAWTDQASWSTPGAHRVFGLASSQIATEVLAEEGVQASNVARWLATQHRLADRPRGGAAAEDEPYRLTEGDLVVVDESAMADTADLAAIHRHIDAASAKLLLVGDHRQLAAVGAGGGMDMLATAGTAYELADARRFNQEWERDASLRLRAGDESVLDEYHRHGRLVDAGAVEQAEQSAVRSWLGDTLAGKRSVLLVDSNEQAARLSAQVRTELVRLGRVDEAGVPLAAQGTFAGPGDLVQARRNGWQLAGYEGNQRGPINRENYRVIGSSEDGGLTVAPILGRTDEGSEQHGAPMTLPASYVAEHLALGYASTVYAAQGVTVDTSHTVVTDGTGAAGLYVGLSRGRESNTAHVTSRAVSDQDAPTGTVNTDTVHRSPKSVLARALETADPTKSALTHATEAAAEAESVRTSAELLADAAELATAGRTAAWLDELAEHGTLTARQRARIAAEDGTATLNRVLRRAELAGHDPKTVLAEAIGDRELAGARRITNVVYKRIAEGWQLDPIGEHYTDRVPAVPDPEWYRYLTTLATEADARTAQLGEQVAAEAPQWAVEAFGPVPDDVERRAEWIDQAGKVAAHRDLSGHEDPGTPLGAPPKSGQPEAYASWRTAWRALGRPEADRDELELSDGQLLARKRAAEREALWAPRYVGNELAGTRQAATTHRDTAQLRNAEAEQATGDEQNRAKLRREAQEAAALADSLERRVDELETVEQARGKWLAHTATTRVNGERAAAEYAARHADDRPIDDTVTAAEWLEAHQANEVAEDPHREITGEHELTDLAEERERDQATEQPDLNECRQERDQQPPELGTTADEPEREEPQQREEEAEATESAAPDIREVAEREAAPEREDDVRVPEQEETNAAVERAQRSLAEIKARQADEARRERDERSQQLAQWHAEDRAAEHAEPEREAEL